MKINGDRIIDVDRSDQKLDKQDQLFAAHRKRNWRITTDFSKQTFDALMTMV